MTALSTWMTALSGSMTTPSPSTTALTGWVPTSSAALRAVTPQRVVDAAGLATASSFGILAALSHTPAVSLPAFGACMAAAWLSFALLFARFAACPGQLPVARVLMWCLALRAIGLFAAPVLEDDFHRYLWDGRSFAIFGNPYGSAPAAHFADPGVPFAFQAVLDGINNPDLPTIYGPVSQLVFLAGYLISPAALWPLKLTLLAADGIAAFALLRLGGPLALLVFAWCPLAIHETAFNAHPDALGVAFALGALLLLTRERVAPAAICLALAVGTKAIALVLLPLFVWRAGVRRAAWLLAAFTATLFALYLPFVVAASATDLPMLLSFTQSWEFNSTLYAVVAAAGGVPAARLFAGITLVTVLALVVAHDRRSTGRGESPTVPRADWLIGALFLVAPIVNPWYLLWLLPFVALHPSRWGLMALCAVSLSYVHGLFVGGLPAYHHPVWVRPAEVGLVALAAAFDLRAASRTQGAAALFDESSSPHTCGEAT